MGRQYWTLSLSKTKRSSRVLKDPERFTLGLKLDPGPTKDVVREDTKKFHRTSLVNGT